MALSIIAPNIEHMLIIMSNILRVNMLEKSYILKDVIHKFLVNNPPNQPIDTPTPASAEEQGCRLLPQVSHCAGSGEWASPSLSAAQ
jgi:hypothetical protein